MSMSSILIKFQPTMMPARICPTFISRRCAADNVSIIGTAYDSNVAGWGGSVSIKQFTAKAAQYPELVSGIRTAILEKSYELKTDNSSLVEFVKANAASIYHEGIRFVVDGAEVKPAPANPTAKVGDVEFSSIAEALDVVFAEEVSEPVVVTLTTNTVEDGIKVPDSKDVTLDLNGHTLMIEGEMTGDTGTKTLAFQLIKDSNITFKNGTIISHDAKMLVQNYSNLTLDNVKLIGSEKNLYVLSNNFGNVVLKNGTVIKATEGNVAFDAYYGMFSVYDEGVTVEISDNSVVIEGKIEFGKAARAKEEDFVAKAHIIVPEGYNLPAPEGFVWEVIEGGKQELVKEALEVEAEVEADAEVVE